jgi:pimeloyl-ACP methyl ester carboxylesterase
MTARTPGEATGARPFYLQTSPDPAFATVHAPAPGRRSSVGVLLCPPFGWSELCTHRSRRTWANELADAGHPVLRIDLQGTGDSAGSLASAGLLDAWISTVATASAWLRDEFACSRVCGLGIGLGGMLAWLAAAEGAPLDDLILWGVPARGRQLVRELQIAAKVDIDFQVEALPGAVDALAPPALEDGDLLDEAGQVISKETLESLAAIDLRQVALPDPERRRALMFRRAGVKSDEVLGEQLRDRGVDVTVQDGAGYDAMMLYVQDSVVPRQEIGRSIVWLSESAGRGSRNGVRRVALDVSAESIEIIENGVAIRETPVSISLPDREIGAVITEPRDAAAENLCVVFSSGGADRRLGPNRLWVEAARSCAARGVTAVRIDPAGVGDSDGDERDWATLWDHYRPRQAEHLRDVLDALEARGLPGRFLLVGFCSGGYRSLHTAVVDARVAGVCAIGLPFFQWTWWAVNIHDSWLTVREPRPEDSALKLRLIRLLQRCLNVAMVGHRAAVTAGQFFPNRGERLIRQLTARGTEVVLILKGASYAHEQLVVRSRRARVRGNDHLHHKKIPGSDRRFRPVVSQRFVRDALDEAILRLLSRRTPGSLTECARVRRAA